MAMLMLNDVLGRAWSARAGRTLPTEYWQDLIPAVKARYPDVLFIAEAYWDLEYELMQKGFDYCYDKRLYDRLVHDDAESVRAHLTAGLGYQHPLPPLPPKSTRAPAPPPPLSPPDPHPPP